VCAKINVLVQAAGDPPIGHPQLGVTAATRKKTSTPVTRYGLPSYQTTQSSKRSNSVFGLPQKKTTTDSCDRSKFEFCAPQLQLPENARLATSRAFK
jgi:hypothetical protein